MTRLDFDHRDGGDHRNHGPRAHEGQTHEERQLGQRGLSRTPAGANETRRRPTPDRGDLSEVLAPFIVWLATQDPDEATRRRHRNTVERFLRWSIDDTGPVRGRRCRYERYLEVHDPAQLAAARAGLDRWDEHRRQLTLTLPHR